MVHPNFYLSFAAIASIVAPAAGEQLAWGTFLGADWRAGEANLRKSLATSIKNTQTICSKDVENICLSKGEFANAHQGAVTDWTNHCTRRMYKQFDQVPIGFGDTADKCLHREFDQYESGTAQHLAPKCVEWLEKTEAKFLTLQQREKGNDMREGFVIFSTIFATAVSLGVGYLFGIFMAERDDFFNYNERHENKRILIFFGVAVSLPICVIIWASPRLFMLMAGAFLIGKLVHLYIQKKSEISYSAVSGSESGLVFAAIPVQMD